MSVLEEIVAGVRIDLAEREARTPLDQVKEAARLQTSAQDPMPTYRAPGVSVIAEVKRASPSVGAIAPIKDPAALAREYEAGGAATISVLTERRRFGGTLNDLREVRAAVDVPVLRKDFIVSSYQLWEARAAGADLALLIVAALDHNALVCLIDRARVDRAHRRWSRCTPRRRSTRALDAGADLIGVNARNLQDPRGRPDTFAGWHP